MTLEEAKDGVKSIMLDKKFGSAGNQMVIEEFMTGREVSVLSFRRRQDHPYHDLRAGSQARDWTAIRVSIPVVWEPSPRVRSIQKK